MDGKKKVLAATIFGIHAVGAVASTTGISNKPAAQDCNTGIALHYRGEFNRAGPLLNRCLSRGLPPREMAYVLQTRADNRYKLGEIDLAISDQRRSLEIARAQDVWPWITLGMYYRAAGNYEEALKALREARNYDEDGPGTGPGMAVEYHTGRTYLMTKEYEKAVNAFTKGIPKQPDYGWAYYYRGLAYEALGNKSAAGADFRKAHQLRPKEGYSEDKEAKISDYLQVTD